MSGLGSLASQCLTRAGCLYLSPRWLGSFGTGREAGLAYDAAAISQKGNKAKTNFQYSDFSSVPRHGAEMVDSVRWDLLPKDIAEVRGVCS